jgi:hypothetical protein
MCYIICRTKPSFFIAPMKGLEPTILGGRRGEAPLNVFLVVFVSFLAVFRHMVFTNGFLILVKELDLLTNLIQWIRGFICHRILYILYCKQ